MEKPNEFASHLRKYKGRVVFGGNNVRDEYGLAALFPEQGSGASFATASKLLDAVSLLPGCFGEQSDAPSAYTQSVLFEGMAESTCPITWVQLPQSQWPPSYHKLYKETGQQPVCRLLKSLYGHPVSGLYWEKHYSKALLDAGFQRIPGWECLYFHASLQVVLSVYVDDFKLAGRKASLPEA